MIELYVFLQFLVVFITYPFNKKSKIIIKSLLNKHSYRFAGSIQTSNRSLLIFYKQVLFFIFKKKSPPELIFSEGTIGIFDGKNKLDRFEYLKKIVDNPPNFHISRDNLIIQGSIHKIVVLILSTTLLLIISPFVLLSKNRKATISLIILEFVEWIALSSTLRRYKCTYLYHFNCYEIDSNFIAYLNQKMNIVNHKIPSSNPLKNFYKYLLCDTLSLTTPFQKSEVSSLSHNWVVNNYVFWPIENFQHLLPYLKTENREKEFDLAFLSSGIWLRQKQGHLSIGIGEHESELELLRLLKNYLKANPKIRFLILLHPIEKKTESIYNEACDYYHRYFEGTNLYVGDKSKSSFEYFSESDTSIAAYSSTNLQRLFCGYKTLYAPLKIKNKLYENSSIENISATNETQLTQLLDQTIAMSDNEFFSFYKLKDYHYSSYNIKFKS